MFRFVLFWLLISPFSLRAEPLVDWAQKVKESSQQKKWEEVAQIVKSIPEKSIHEGYRSWNLAIAAMYQEKWGEALYYAEKALVFFPRNAELRAEYDFIKSKIGKIEDIRGKIFRWGDFVFFWKNWATLQEWTYSLGSVWLIFWGLSLVFFFKNRYPKMIYLTGIFLALFLGGSCFLKWYEQSHSWAIVLQTDTPVLNTILEKESTRKLQLGARVEILSTQLLPEGQEYYQISLPSEKTGWVAASHLGLMGTN